MTPGAFDYLRPGDRVRLSRGWCGTYGEGIVVEIIKHRKARGYYEGRLII